MIEVVLGVCGGIAAYKSCELLRLFTESGHGVRVVPTAAALKFVGAPTWAALSGRPVACTTGALAAAFFCDLCKSVHFLPVLLCVREPPTTATIKAHIAAATAMFLRAYPLTKA